MTSVLARIRSAALRGALRFTQKARQEIHLDALTIQDVRESLVAATRIKKTLTSRSPQRHGAREKLYVIQSRNFNGTPIYTKGTFRRDAASGEAEIYYILVSAKRSWSG